VVKSAPLFTVVVSSYNREVIVCRCVRSCLAQSIDDFELIVVDDASEDDTLAALAKFEDPRLEIVAHETNLGISTTRQDGVKRARGEWIVIVDSDDELVPDALERLRELIADLPPYVRVIRSQLRWDDGSVTPHYMPDSPIGYERRIRWLEAEGGSDAGRCVQRAAFESTPYVEGRRGAMETLWELDLARTETSLCVEDVLGVGHTDAPNSWLRSVSASIVVPRLLEEAPDMLWMAQTTLDRHGKALRRLAPHWYVAMLRLAATQSFLLGERANGLRYSRRALRSRPWDVLSWCTVALGLIGPGAVARGTMLFRRVKAFRG
jgi:glycosyltransferase involved in cell wall biosynthesis